MCTMPGVLSGTKGAVLLTLLLLSGIPLSGFPVFCAENTVHALVIGIDNYKGQGNNCRFADEDAKGFALALNECCGVQDVRLLVNKNATRQAIQKEMDRLTDIVYQEDVVVFYYAGHGSHSPDSDGDEGIGDGLDEVLVPYDYQATEESKYLVDDELALWANRLRAKAVLLVVIDSCFSGGLGRSLKMEGRVLEHGGGLGRDLLDFPGSQTSIVLAVACEEHEVASPNDRCGHGLFTCFLLQGIERKRADMNFDGAVTTDELADYIAEKLEQYPHQTPVYMKDNPELNLILVPSSAESRDLPFRLVARSAPAINMIGGLTIMGERYGLHFRSGVNINSSLSINGMLAVMTDPFEFRIYSTDIGLAVIRSPISLELGVGPGIYEVPEADWRSWAAIARASLRVPFGSYFGLSLDSYGVYTYVDSPAVFGFIGVSLMLEF